MGTTAEKLAYLDATKTAIKDAIVAKGVDVPEGTTFRQYAGKIAVIETGVNRGDMTFSVPQRGSVTVTVPKSDYITVVWVTESNIANAYKIMKLNGGAYTVLTSYASNSIADQLSSTFTPSGDEVNIRFTDSANYSHNGYVVY